MQTVSTMRSSAGWGDGVRPALVGSAVVGSLFLLVILSKAPVIQNRLRRWLPRARLESERKPNLPALRASILGREKSRVAEVMGQPVAETGGLSATWYYPVETNEKLTMAVSFEDDRASGVEFFHPPGNHA